MIVREATKDNIHFTYDIEKKREHTLSRLTARESERVRCRDYCCPVERQEDD